jgi:predicted SAM-dependent methyltransferase
MEPSILHLGCGLKKRPDAVNVDCVASVRPDVVHDLDRRPWPFRENQFREVLAYDVIEHLDSTVAALEEIHRICEDGAVVRLTVPHFSCANAFTDPTHRHYFSSASFHYFTGDNEFPFYSEARFRRQLVRIVFRDSLPDKIVWQLANRWPGAYERRWAWIWPAWFLYVELVVVKPSSD